MEGNNKNKINLNIALVCVAIVLLLVTIILLVSFPDKETGSGSNTNPEATVVPVEDKIELTDIETPYGILKFPSERYSYLKITETNENGVFSQTYYCVKDNLEMKLYTVYFGETEQGESFGYINKDNENIPFRILFYDVKKPEGWTEDQYYIAKVMLEDVNFIIESAQAW